MSAASKPVGEDAKNNPQRVAEESARMAESVHKKVEKLSARVASLGRQQLDAAIEVGHHLIKAKEILGHGNFENEQKRWRVNRTITFSERSGRRYMLLASFAEEIKSANVANLREAEKLVSELKDAANAQKAGAKEKADRSGEPLTATATSATAVENQILKTMRRFAEASDQRAFLGDLIEKLSHRLQLLLS